MNAHELRRRYLEFFRHHDHKVLPSSPLVPNDPTLLLTSAGMVQFKDLFWGRTAPSFRRATTCQKCFRTTDIENVGRTAFHNTFFEMLGNFSFGDYFKEGAIRLAWEFLVDELGLAAERLSVSVYQDDDEAHAIWRDVAGLPESRITRLGREHNWWGPVGNSGPCGPDSEIFYDTGEGRACGPDCAGVACDCDRYSEIWNLVFMQYDAKEDGSLAPLATKNIDTGMGLERTSAVLQGVETVFENDLYRPIVEAIEAACGRELRPGELPYRNAIADHVRGILFLLAEGIMPGNERQGYILRRILRRAVRAGEKIDLPAGALAGLVDPVVDTLGDVYPEIVAAHDLAHRLVTREEETFRRTLRDGERRLEKLIEERRAAGEAILAGELVFELFDTYGFPFEMTEEIAADSGISVDRAAYAGALETQRARSRGGAAHLAAGASTPADVGLHAVGKEPTEFVGYGRVEDETTVESILRTSDRIARLVFPKSPFYAESGGQVSDTGRIENLTRSGTARVTNVQKSASGVFLHEVEIASGTFEIGDHCQLNVDVERRNRIRRNHTSTHLLHAALREVLGAHVKQAGSEVNDLELRFDFSHFERMPPEEIARVEDLVNAAVLANRKVETSEVALEEARELGAIGLFDEEYRGKEKVRLVRVGGVSMELCGGTHVARTGEIGLVKVIAEESIAAGVRRIRAISGDAVLRRIREQDDAARRLQEEVGGDPMEGIRRLKEELRGLREQVQALAASEVRDVASELVTRAEAIGGARMIGGRADLAAEQLKQLADTLEERARPAAVLLVADAGGRGITVCKRSKELEAIDAGAVIRTVARALGGGGGGGKPFAQGGGPKVDRLDEALEAGLLVLREALA